MVISAGAVLMWRQDKIPFFGKRHSSEIVSAGKLNYHKDVKPLLNQYCFDCHNPEKNRGELSLVGYAGEEDVVRDRKVWLKVVHNLRNGEMPPPSKPQPTQGQRDMLVSWIESEIFKCDCDKPDPGRVTIRRLNRAEYNNTIRDLVGVNFSPADDFPADDSGHGFDNIGDVLSLPPILFEKYLTAAQKILDQAIVADPMKAVVMEIAGQSLEGGTPYDRVGRFLGTTAEIFTSYKFPADGNYVLRVEAFGQQAGPEPVRMAFRIDGREIRRFDVRAVEGEPGAYQARFQATAGNRKVSVAFLNDYYETKSANVRLRGDRNMVVMKVEMEGPLGVPRELPETHARIFFKPYTSETRMSAGREILTAFARRAFRRPVEPAEIDRLMKFVELAEKNGDRFERGIQLALQAVLVSPHFLFRGEIQANPNDPLKTQLIGEHTLASRLSYFLWSSMPDAELMAEADQGSLRKNLLGQVKRMLRDPKSQALVENFAGQWLQLRNLKLVAPDKKEFPDFDDALRLAMERETELLFDHIMRDDRSIMEFLDADYTFVNQRLARHYGVAPVAGDDFVKVSLKGTPRRGLLTHGSILTITSNPTRTSPVKRGKFVLDNVLGTPPPPPTPEVPDLAESKAGELTGTLRQRMEQHRQDPTCASCHARMDPIGFGMENFDGIGAWRTEDGAAAIDSRGELVGGEKFSGPDELISVLLRRRRTEFIRCLSEKMLTYALGRGIEYYDKCAIDEISDGVTKADLKFSALIVRVVMSTPFQKRRGEGDPVEMVSR
ncbi:MAG: DUF1592 domain-containing protein [Opitutaceae bacterium]|nr:DUF1592 domain-containing protein [Verrucomicrobiales bacterium]